jgi:hypothetical protein
MPPTKLSDEINIGNHVDIVNIWAPMQYTKRQRASAERELAVSMGVSHDVVRSWRRRDFIPPWYWPRLVSLFSQRGLRLSYASLTMATLGKLGKRTKFHENV